MKSNLAEVFKTAHGGIYQCDDSNCYWVEFAGTLTPFKFHCFWRLKKIIDGIDIDAMINDTAHNADIEIISPCSCERCYVLTIQEVIYFKELLAGAKVMLELNSILHEKLKSIIV